MTRDFIQKVYIRVCRDSGFMSDHMSAVSFTAELLGISALRVAFQFPHLSDLETIADGTHPCLKEAAV